MRAVSIKEEAGRGLAPHQENDVEPAGEETRGMTLDDLMGSPDSRYKGSLDTKCIQAQQRRRESLYGRQSSDEMRSTFEMKAAPYMLPTSSDADFISEGGHKLAASGVSSLDEYLNDAGSSSSPAASFNVMDRQSATFEDASRARRMSQLYEGLARNSYSGAAPQVNNLNFENGEDGLSFSPNASAGILHGSSTGQNDLADLLLNQPPPPPPPLAPGGVLEGGETFVAESPPPSCSPEPTNNVASTAPDRKRSSVVSLSRYLVPDKDVPAAKSDPSRPVSRSSGKKDGSVDVADPLKAATLAKEKELAELKVTLDKLTKENAAFLNALLCAVYKLNEAPLHDHHVNAIKALGINGSEKIKKVQKKMPPTRRRNQEVASILDDLAASKRDLRERRAGVQRRREDKAKSGISRSPATRWTSLPEHVVVSPQKNKSKKAVSRQAAAYKSQSTTSLASRELLRKNAIVEGLLLYEDEWGEDGRYGRSLQAADRVRKARELAGKGGLERHQVEVVGREELEQFRRWRAEKMRGDELRQALNIK